MEGDKSKMKVISSPWVPYVTTLHECCAMEYTLTAILAGTYSVLAAVLQGARVASPNALVSINVTLVGMTILNRLLSYPKAIKPIVRTPVGMLMLERLVQDLNACAAIEVTPVGRLMPDKLVQ